MNISLINNPRGLNARQFDAFKKIVKITHDVRIVESPLEFHLGGDRQDSQIAEHLFTYPDIKIHVHPLVNSNAKVRGHVYYPPVPISERNRTLIDSATLIIAAPMVIFEFEDSSTWRTINYAISKNKNLKILSPKGTLYTTETLP